jgi:alcohol dehydrogenase
MRAVVFHGPGQKHWEEVPDPKIVDDSDAIVRIISTTICGTDLHILKGDVPAMTPGRILGHEAVGTVTEIGPGVRSVKRGDHVLLSCISACGRCRFARVPFADTSTYQVPEGLTDEQVLYLADILPTGYEVGVLNGQVQPGDTVAIVGAGPVGLAAILGARLYSPAAIVAIDPTPARRDWAEQFGAAVVTTPEGARGEIDQLTEGLGADVAVEAVGIPETFEQCTELIRPGGRVANVGVHGKPATLHLESLWIKGVTITTGLVDTFSTPTLLKSVAAGQIDPTRFTTHRFPLQEAIQAYDTFARAGETNALKVLLTTES